MSQADPGPPPPIPDGEPLRVVFVASHIPLHGVSTVIEAARILRGDRVAFTMIGAGQGLPEAERAANDVAGIEVIPRVLPREEIARHYAASHVGRGIFGTTAKAARVVPL